MATIKVEGTTTEFTGVVKLIDTDLLGRDQTQPQWLAG